MTTKKNLEGIFNANIATLVMSTISSKNGKIVIS